MKFLCTIVYTYALVLYQVTKDILGGARSCVSDQEIDNKNLCVDECAGFFTYETAIVFG